MRTSGISVWAVSALLGVAPSSNALEKTAARLTDRGEWSAASTGTVVPCVALSYFNTCTGWVWVWGGWNPGDRMGVVFENVGQCTGGWYPDPTPRLVAASTLQFWTGSPAGYGFTGTLSLFAAEDGCPSGAPIQTQAFLPPSGPATVSWNAIVPTDFALTFSLGPGDDNPVTIATDHPARGPTGPVACGVCFPADRVAHSFTFGTADSPLCPGVAFDDGVCHSELVWEVEGQLGAFYDPVSVESASWGEIKALFR